ncbi:MAG: alpha/beta fold hydrolase [Planctomycetota bacterium]|nr:alpha/beta fold hydrolase [Planctomycetota bacterium]
MTENGPEMTADPGDVVFLHGWCGHGDEVEGIRSAFSGRVLAPSWMPAPGSFDLESWPLPADRGIGEAERAMRAFADDALEGVRRTIVDAGFVGATIVGHSLGGCMACVLANDPMLAIPRVVLLDSSVPMPVDRRDAMVERMIAWVDRAATGGRLVAQAGWIADASSWVPDLFNLEDQGAARLRIERRFMFAPVVEAALTVAGGMQWPITEAIGSLPGEVHGLAGDPTRMPVDDLRAVRPEARIEILEGTGHFAHVLAAERTRTWLVHGPLRPPAS